jgi:hypothetical protein
MRGSVIHFSKASRDALKKRAEEAEAALTSEQKEEREKVQAELARKAEAALQSKVEEDAAGVIGRSVLKHHHKRKHRAGTRRRRRSRGKTSRRK